MIGDRLRMAELARSFPELHKAPIDPFVPEELDRWACSGAPGHGGSCAARFVLSVWSGGTGALDVGKKRGDRVWAWKARRFDLHEALGVWDHAHRSAFIAWARAPWWP
jgi:hypothetical protein